MFGVAHHTERQAPPPAAGSSFTPRPGLHRPSDPTTWPRTRASGSSRWNHGARGAVVPQKKSWGMPRVTGWSKSVTCMNGPQGLSVRPNRNPVRSVMFASDASSFRNPAA